jgi:ADP-ribosylglycohydrolase
MGGDTDSTASIVAAMSLFQHGDVTHRPNDFEQTLHYIGLRDVSRGLVEAAA